MTDTDIDDTDPGEDTNFYWELHGCSATLEEIPEGAEIVSRGDITCMGTCENCNKPIFENEDYFHDEDGIKWHTHACTESK